MARQPGHVQVISAGVRGASFDSDVVCWTDTARTVEVWITITAAAAADWSFEVQTGLKSADLATDADWKTIKNLNNVTATGKYVLLAVRETEALGEQLRIVCTRTTGTIDMTADVLTKED